MNIFKKKTYNKRQWHIVKFVNSYGIRRVGIFGISFYLSKNLDSSYSSSDMVKQYCLFYNVEEAERRLKEWKRQKEEIEAWKNPTFIKQ